MRFSGQARLWKHGIGKATTHRLRGANFTAFDDRLQRLAISERTVHNPTQAAVRNQTNRTEGQIDRGVFGHDNIITVQRERGSNTSGRAVYLCDPDLVRACNARKNRAALLLDKDLDWLGRQVIKVCAAAETLACAGEDNGPHGGVCLDLKHSFENSSAQLPVKCVECVRTVT